MRKTKQLLKLAAKVAVGNGKGVCRNYRVGAVAIRADGTIVSSRNLPNNRKNQTCHAEARVLRKAGRDSIVYVARIGLTGALRMAKPCPGCYTELFNRKVKKCYYSISDNEYGVIAF